MKYCLSLMMVVIFLFSCKKENNNNNYIQGKIFINDTYTSNTVKAPLADATIKISDGANTTSNFLYSVKSDREGYFIFENLEFGKNYLVFAETEKTNSSNSKIIYFDSFKVDNIKRENSVTLNLTANNAKQNGLFINTVDQFGGILQNVNVYLYSSKVLAIADSAAITGVGSAYQLQSDNFGRVFKTNLTTPMYVNAKGVYGTVILKNQLYQAQLNNSGITSSQLTLK